jgi:hypothetical protein
MPRYRYDAVVIGLSALNLGFLIALVVVILAA